MVPRWFAIQFLPKLGEAALIHQVFTEFDAFEDAIQHASVRMTLNRRERPHWVLGSMSLSPLHLQWGTTGGSLVSEGEILPGGHCLFVPLNHFSINGVNGRRLNEDSIMVADSASEFCVAIDGWIDWFSLFVPHAVGSGDATYDRRGRFPHCRVVSIDRFHLRQVRIAVRNLIKIVTSGGSPEPADCSAAKRILQRFADRAIAQHDPADERRRGRPVLDRPRVVQLIAEELVSPADSAVRAADLADVAHVSQRTLHRVFQDWFGISPMRFARLRQLHRVRDALLDADPSSTTVTAVLADNDVEQFGRFAALYRLLFGELPSKTLVRAKRSGLGRRPK